jgi:molybdenum cofactor cytidylyltransferase
MLGRLGDKPVIGAPGCARSPKENGFDWVLHRLLADVPIARADIQGMGVGGLLMEIIARPSPRAPAIVRPPAIATVILAAGSARRMGRNKLVEVWNGRPILRHVAEAALAGPGAPVLVVTGHEPERAGGALEGLDVRFVHNSAYAAGLSTSLQAGLAAVPTSATGAIIMLGDMPRVTPAILGRLAVAFADRPEAMAVVPTVAGQRGNPILIARALFPAVMALAGDIGARRLIDEAGDGVAEVAIDDAAILTDVDTPEALAALRAAAEPLTSS